MTATTTGPRRQDELAGPRGSGRPHTSTSRERHQAHHPGAGGLSPEARRAFLRAWADAVDAQVQAEATAALKASQRAREATHGAWQERLATMSPSALAELESAVRFGESLAYPEAYEQGVRDGFRLGERAGQARGRYLEAAAADDADRRWRAQVGRDVAASAARPSYAELCERRGEPERAERARRLLAERGIA
ncbi:hypothetical protein [uncultured Actinomyces sp.]|uniref:hypothetical protein n=1 Tax=uncultured Actinomyces sp. TaxID=249061 RepID=UPI0028E20BA0|nr:hypothetical protein [uncultured Actinomyces sp.]